LELLPDGTELDPRSLNEWFKREADGYLGEGMLNWLAGTRLSRLISTKYATEEHTPVTLELHRYSSALADQLSEMIGAYRPGIVQLPGHFLVAQGFNSAENDFYISDPAYTYRYLSQHQQPMVSVLDFVPTHTDLSYLMIINQPHLTVEVRDELQQLIETDFSQDTMVNQFYHQDECSTESEADSQECAYHQSMPVVQFLSKPATGNYSLKVSSTEPGFSQISTLVYDVGGNVRQFDRYLYFPQTNEGEFKTLDLVVDGNDLGEAELIGHDQPNFIEFAQLLEQGFHDDQLPINLYIYFRRMINLITINLSQPAQDRYQQLLLKLLAEFQVEINENLQDQLAAVLSE
jgi:hypothetical protein